MLVKKGVDFTVAHVASGSAAFMIGLLSLKDILMGGSVLDIVSDIPKIREVTRVMPGVCSCVSMISRIVQNLNVVMKTW